MDTAQALSILKLVAAEFVGNLKDHERVQEALSVIAKALEPEKDADKAPSYTPQPPKPHVSSCSAL